MKSVLISIQPKWCEFIANGKKTVEVRKTRPKIETPFKVYIYCTNSQRQYLRKIEIPYQVFLTENKDILGKTEKVKQILGDVTTFAVGGGYNGKEWHINIHWWKDRHNFKTLSITYPFIGKEWYLTKEEAEEKLKGGEG